MLIYFGEFKKSLSEIERAMRLDPFSHDLLFGVEALCHYWLGNYDKAIESYRKLKVIRVQNFYLALAYLKKGNRDLAIEKYNEARVVTGKDVEAFVNSEPYKDPEHIESLKTDLISLSI